MRTRLLYRSLFLWVVILIVVLTVRKSTYSNVPVSLSQHASDTKTGPKPVTENTKPGTGNVLQINDVGQLAKVVESSSTQTAADPAKTKDNTPPKDSDVQKFFRSFFKIVMKNEPSGIAKLEKYSSDCRVVEDVGYWESDEARWGLLSFDDLNRCLMISKQEKQHLSQTHQKFVQELQLLSFPEQNDFYQKDGIVVVGGSKFSILAFEMIKVIRAHGSSLPVEVFIPPGESDPEFCTFIKSNLNAKCISIDRIFPPDIVESYNFKGYQFKSLAMLASSFENLLLLDADNLPIVDLDDIFQSQVYRDNGMIIWPDYWRRTTSPKYYSIAQISVDFTHRARNFVDDLTPSSVYTDYEKMDPYSDIPLHDFQGALPDPSTESGQLMINKKTHLSSLLLSFYYNVHGPKYYYPIFSQGRSGEGDKESFIAAAHYYNLTYYQVKSSTGSDGYHKKDGSGFKGIAMYQRDFREDYQSYLSTKREVLAQYGEINGANSTDDFVPRSSVAKNLGFDPNYSAVKFHQKHYGNKASSMFVHCNIPKFDPLMMYRNNENVYQGQHFRSFNNLKELKGFDLELTIFKIFKDHVCTKMQNSASSWGSFGFGGTSGTKNLIQFQYLTTELKDLQERDEMCLYIQKRYEYLSQNGLDTVTPL